MQQGIRRRNICMRKRGLGIGISHSSINKRVRDRDTWCWESCGCFPVRISLSGRGHWQSQQLNLAVANSVCTRQRLTAIAIPCRTIRLTDRALWFYCRLLCSSSSHGPSSSTDAWPAAVQHYCRTMSPLPHNASC
jgi:hypothetical protein